MKLLPKEDVTYKTYLSNDEVVEKLSNITVPVNLLRITTFRDDTSIAYEGIIGKQKFYIRRIVQGRNSFAPEIRGTIISDEEGTTINVKMSLLDSVLTFVAIWCVLAGAGGVFLLYKSFTTSNFGLKLLLPFLMILMAYALTKGRL